MIRDFGEGDALALAKLQYQSIAHFGPQRYSAKQVKAWLGRTTQPEAFLAKASSGVMIRIAYPAQDASACGGYMVLEQDGHLDHLYVAPAFASQGHASALIAHAQALGRTMALPGLSSEVSEIARPVFEKCGWHTDHRRDLEIDGVAIHNYAMSKKLR